MKLTKLGVLAALVFSGAAGSAQAQGTPPFSPTNLGSASQRVNILPSIDQDDGSHSIEITPVSGGGLQQRSQSSVYAKHGRLWTIPGSVAWLILPGSPNEQASAPLPNDADFRPFLVSEDPVTVPSATAPFLFAGSHFFDANCSTATCGYLAGGLESEAESSFNVINGTLNAQARASTPNYGRRWFNDSPFVDSTYDHIIQSRATAQIRDWVYVTGPGSTATLVVNASVTASLSFPQVPVTVGDWTTPVYGDIRQFNPCADNNPSGDTLLDPSGARTNSYGLSLGVASGYQLVGANWIPSVLGNQELDVERGTDLHWADEEGLSNCTDDFAEVTPISVGSFTPSLTLQVVVPTNQWARISALASADAECVGPFTCDLDATTTAHLTITSPNGSLVSWQGIAGLTPVPEPTGALAAGLVALGLCARSGKTRRRS